MFNSSYFNQTVDIAIPRYAWGLNANYGAFDRYDEDSYVQLTIVPYASILDTSCKITWSSGRDYKLTGVYVEY